jgi:hypothetical protein
VARFLFAITLACIFTFVTIRSESPQRDSQAVSLATQSLAVLTNSVAVNDVALNGGVSWIAGTTVRQEWRFSKPKVLERSGVAMLSLIIKDRSTCNWRIK